MTSNDLVRSGAFVLEQVGGPLSLLVKAVRCVTAGIGESGETELRLDRLEAGLADIRRTLGGRQIRGNAVAVIQLLLNARLNELWAMVGAEDVANELNIPLEAFAEAADELRALGLVTVATNLCSPIGMARAIPTDEAYFRVGTSVFPHLPIENDALTILSVLRQVPRSSMSPAPTLLEQTGIPLARFDLTNRALRELGLITTHGTGDLRWGSYTYLEITALGKRVLKGDDPLF